MTNQPTQNNNSPTQIIICDTNIVVLMTLFKPSVMFSANYTSGKVRVHQCVIDQLQNWIDKKNAKATRLTLPILEKAVSLCKPLSQNIKEPTPEQFKRSARYIANKEIGLPASEKGMATDIVDQKLLILAFVNNATLATQERTMTSIAGKTLPPGRVLRFEDLVLDLLNLSLLTSSDVEVGLESLDHFKEKLDATKRKQIESYIQSPKE
jgi:hypothetical protein